MTADPPTPRYLTVSGQLDAEHQVADEWKDCVLVCACGWRTADRTKTEARKQWVVHVHKAAAGRGAPKEQP